MSKNLKELVEIYKPRDSLLDKHRTAAANRFKRTKIGPLLDREKQAVHSYVWDDTKPKGQSARDLSNAINQSKTHRHMYLYHGAGFDPSKVTKNGVVKIKGHLSTTHSLEFATMAAKKDKNENNGHILKIKTPKGTKFAKGQEESNEFILKKGTKLRIHDKKHIDMGDLGKHHIWHASVEESEKPLRDIIKE